MLKQRDSIHSSFTVTRVSSNSSGSSAISNGISNGSSSKAPSEDSNAEYSILEDGSTDGKDKSTKKKWFNLNLKGSDRKLGWEYHEEIMSACVSWKHPKNASLVMQHQLNQLFIPSGFNPNYLVLLWSYSYLYFISYIFIRLSEWLASKFNVTNWTLWEDFFLRVFVNLRFFSLIVRIDWKPLQLALLSLMGQE